MDLNVNTLTHRASHTQHTHTSHSHTESLTHSQTHTTQHTPHTHNLPHTNKQTTDTYRKMEQIEHILKRPDLRWKLREIEGGDAGWRFERQMSGHERDRVHTGVTKF